VLSSRHEKEAARHKSAQQQADQPVSDEAGRGYSAGIEHTAAQDSAQKADEVAPLAVRL
jgi:hypothetical protein